MTGEDRDQRRSAALRIIVAGDGPWYSGDVLQGHVEFATDYHSEDININLEGTLRSWMFQGDPEVDDPHEETVEHQVGQPPSLKMLFAYRYIRLNGNEQLLSMIFMPCDGDNDNEYLPPVNGGGDCGVHCTAFYFQIPHTLPSPVLSPCPRFLLLPPSMSEGRQFIDPVKHKLYMQPLILYTIKAQVLYRKRKDADTQLSTVTAEREVDLFPRTGFYPPCAVEDFPDDFRFTATAAMKRFPWPRALGIMEVSAVEPDPVLLPDSREPSALSSCTLSLSFTFDPARPDVQSRYFTMLRCHVECELRSKTYTALRPMEKVPDKQALSSDKRIYLRSGVTQLQGQDLLLNEWHRASGGRESEKESEAPPSGLSRLASSLNMPIPIPGDLTPEFLHRYSARLYALVIRVRFPDFSHKPFKLEVPLQVVCPQNEPDLMFVN
ncbi:hypothetical protein BJX64DRAFT_295459 [Aspergillus heterothallicus]